LNRFPFDHIYAYEITPTPPADVVQALPDTLRAACHWINVGVDAAPDSPNNPLRRLVLDHYEPNDIVIVKLDIDNTALELKFVEQLLSDDRYRGGLIDHFYFEHHLDGRYERRESIQLFLKLREKGIPAHYWV